jgi:hypothetical protein
MENKELDKFQQVPDSFLTEVTESEFMSDIKKEDNVLSVTDSTEEIKIEQKPNVPEIGESIPSIDSGSAFTQHSVGINNFLNEELGTELYDAIVTSIAMTALNAFGIESTKSEMSFTAKEKNVLKPIIKECIDTLDIKFTNPFEALAWTTLLLVGTKIMTTKGEQIADKMKAKPSLKKVIKKEKDTKKVTSRKQMDAIVTKTIKIPKEKI